MSDSPAVLKKFRIFIVTLFLAALSLIVAPSSARGDDAKPWSAMTSEDYYVIVSAWDGVNIREYPGVNYDKLAFASQGTRLHVIGSVTNENGKPWLRIDYPSGWAAASEVTNERYYTPPAPAITESAPVAPKTTPTQTATKTVTATAKAPDAEQSSQKSGISKGLVIALVAIVAVICIISILLLYMLFIRGKKNLPGSPGVPW